MYGAHKQREWLMNKRILKLNQSYEPIEIINWKKAVKLIVKGKAEIIRKYDGISLGSGSCSFAFPAVIRLNKAHQDHELFWKYVTEEGMPLGFSIGGKPVEEPTFMEIEE